MKVWPIEIFAQTLNMNGKYTSCKELLMWYLPPSDGRKRTGCKTGNKSDGLFVAPFLLALKHSRNRDYLPKSFGVSANPTVQDIMETRKQMNNAEVESLIDSPVVSVTARHGVHAMPVFTGVRTGARDGAGRLRGKCQCKSNR